MIIIIKETKITKRVGRYYKDYIQKAVVVIKL